MRTATRLLLIVCLGACLGTTAATNPSAEDNWPSFRGARADGVAEGYTLPTSWDRETRANIRWSVEIPGVAHASPIVWGERVFVVTAVAEEPAADRRATDLGNSTMADRVARSWRIQARDRGTGALLWEHEAHRGVPQVSRHEKATHANSTPATDGHYVVAVYASEGMYCYDLEGNVLWRKDLGRLDTGLWGSPDTPWGHASSPVIWGDTVLVQSDSFENSFLAAFRLADGSEVWRVERAEKNTWSTPTILEVGGIPQVITNGGNFIRAYDVRNGRELWRFADEAEVKVPTPVAADDRVIISGGWPQGRPIHAIDPSASGAIGTGPGQEGLLWRVDSGGPYTTTPLAYRGLLYSVTDSGIASVYDLDSGARLARQRLRGGFSASAVAGDGKVYFASEDGEVFVVAAGSDLEVVATVDMGEPIFATPALSQGEIFLRTRGWLYVIDEAD